MTRPRQTWPRSRRAFGLRRVVISQDEAEFHLFPYLVLIWGLIGSPQLEVRTPGKNEKRCL